MSELCKLSVVSTGDKTHRSELNSVDAKRQTFRNYKDWKEEHTAQTIEKWVPGLRVGGIAACTCLAKGHVSLEGGTQGIPAAWSHGTVCFCLPSPPAFLLLDELSSKNILWTLYWAKLGDGLWASGEFCNLPT